MKFTKIASVLLAVLLVATAGAAAMPGNAPDEAQTEQADGNYENGSDAAADAGENRADTGQNGNASAANAGDAGAANADDKRGPPTDMPGQVPDFVTEIHDLINQHIDGSLDDLGAAISDVTPDESDGAEDADGEGDDDPEETDADDADDDSADEDDADDADEDDADDGEA